MTPVNTIDGAQTLAADLSLENQFIDFVPEKLAAPTSSAPEQDSDFADEPTKQTTTISWVDPTNVADSIEVSYTVIRKDAG